MKRSKARQLKEAGWKVGTARELLGLSDEEATLIEVKLALAHYLKSRRTAIGLSQNELARRLGSSQSRVAKLESADPSVSIDLLVRSLLTLGATRQEVGRAMGRKAAIPAA
jgi:DNA-binding XRE family transcriptional regulator